MKKRIIQLCYRKIIDVNSGDAWEKLVFEDSYREFLMQSQLYNQQKKYNSFAEIIRNDPKAEKLHFLVGASIIGYLRQLNEMVPDILNALGKHFLKFKNFRFEIINSDTRDRSKHQVAINFYSVPLKWHDTIGNQLLVSLNNEEETEEYQTELLTLQPFLSIYSLKEME